MWLIIKTFNFSHLYSWVNSGFISLNDYETISFCVGKTDPDLRDYLQILDKFFKENNNIFCNHSIHDCTQEILDILVKFYINVWGLEEMF